MKLSEFECHCLLSFYSLSFHTIFRMTTDAELTTEVPVTRVHKQTSKKSAHHRTQSIASFPTKKNYHHSRRGSLPTTIPNPDTNSSHRSLSLLSPIPPLPERGSISIQIANPKSDVASQYITRHENTIKNLSYIMIWYFFSTSLSLYNKNLMGRDRFNFNFPLLVSAIHAGLHAVITTMMMWLGGSRWKSNSAKISLHDYLLKVVK